MARRTRAKLKTEYLVGRATPGSMRAEIRHRNPLRPPRYGAYLRKDPGETGWARTEIPTGDEARKKANKMLQDADL
jgi:hypothetical protein